MPPAHPPAHPTALPLPQRGAHVKVVRGPSAGETGMVVRVDGPVCHIFTDVTQKELRAFARDLAEAVAVASSADS